MVMTTGFIRRGNSAEGGRVREKVSAAYLCLSFMDPLFDWHLIATILCETEKNGTKLGERQWVFAENDATRIMRIIFQQGKDVVNWVFVQNTLNPTFSGSFGRFLQWSRLDQR